MTNFVVVTWLVVMAFGVGTGDLLHATQVEYPTEVILNGIAGDDLPFTVNVGQFDESVLFRTDAYGAVIWLTHDGIYYHFQRLLNREDNQNHPATLNYRIPNRPDSVENLIIRSVLVGGNPDPEISSSEEMDYLSHYFLGNRPEYWYRNVPSFREVTYKQVYPGIDLKFKGTSAHLEYDFIVHPGADPNQIQVSYQGIDSLSIDQHGNLVIATRFGTLVEQQPVTYQLSENKQINRESGYVLMGKNTVGFTLASGYDPALPLIIDPVLTYSGFLGGGTNDFGRAVAVDSSCSVYVSGYVSSLDFPVENPFDSTYNDTGTVTYDAFVSKLSPAGDSLLFSTYLGSSESDRGLAIGIDFDGYVYLGGVTSSADFPTVNPVQADKAEGQDAFLAKLSPTGDNLVYATFLGGNGDDVGVGLAVDNDGRLLVVGNTNSPDFILSGNPYDNTLDGPMDGFAARLSQSGASL
ncbi:MAG: SBBP repeat-containing protein, partial [candidate division Zixibacteria bacterium]|nr:SBBP repeat-containing protein [candidate division Zixibacteria bacterium]